MTRNGRTRRLLVRTLLAGLVYLLITLAIFFAYRVVFLRLFSPTGFNSDAPLIFLYGMRIDIALVALEILFVTTLFLLSRWLRLRVLSGIFAGLTVMHGALSIANLLFFRERGQHFWEMLLANFTRPDEILKAVWPFLRLHLGAGSVVLLMLFLLLFTGCWLVRRVPSERFDLWQSRRGIVLTTILMFLLLLINLDPAAFQERKFWRLGWIPMPTASQFYMRFDSYQANQAVVNPLHDFVRFYIPATLAGFQGEKDRVLSNAAALSLGQSLLGTPIGDREYPLVRSIPPGPELGLKNVIIIQVEGLSASILYHQEEGQQVTPFLNELASHGLYFTNIMQSFNATDGAVMSTITSFHKAFFNKNWEYFLPVEINGYFTSLPHILGSTAYRHLGMHGFENRREDFSAFLRNQGFEAFDLTDFEARLASRSETLPMRNALGLFDHVLLQQAAEIIGDLPDHFTVHIMTATSHSPWVIPETADRPFTNERMNVFRYVDQCIAGFVKSLEVDRTRFAETLMVVVADHTSVLTGAGLLNSLRVPVIFYSPALQDFAGKQDIDTEILASQVDILPTVLQLLDGTFEYGGMGTSLLVRQQTRPGVISSTRYESFYLKDDFVFHYAPYLSYPDKMQLWRRAGDTVHRQDIATDNPERFKQLQREYFALYETSDVLAKEKRIMAMREVRDGKKGRVFAGRFE